MTLPMVLSSAILLRGQRVLVVEDSFLFAQEIAELLYREGVEMVGPVSTVSDAERLARETTHLDAAILDVNLRGEMIWPVADMLSSRNVRLVFATGYAAAAIKARYANAHVAEKPAPVRLIARLLSKGQHFPGGGA